MDPLRPGTSVTNDCNHVFFSRVALVHVFGRRGSCSAPAGLAFPVAHLCERSALVKGIELLVEAPFEQDLGEPALLVHLGLDATHQPLQDARDSHKEGWLQSLCILRLIVEMDGDVVQDD